MTKLCDSLLILLAERGVDKRLDVCGQCRTILRDLALGALDGRRGEVQGQLGVGVVLGDGTKLGDVLVAVKVLLRPLAGFVVGQGKDLGAAGGVVPAPLSKQPTSRAVSVS